MKTRFKQLRIEKGITQERFAEMYNKSQRAVSLWENDEREPSYDILCSIADFYEVSIDYLIGRTDIRTYEKELTSEERKQALAIGEAALKDPKHPTVENNQEMMQAIEAVVRKVLAEQQSQAQ